ncbi:hypothetical protein H6F67_27180 [Microcoleus sp. FACHB-1515]|uniref:hypothetical protein n=1 Tax=Cyanophyceae TaxID=3028117 RepID=UPI001689FF48|nr:hypothetical protein [Microcoleus sp. FACHB-1515]MBD2093522.1 hypothetical protein [Microcoleus sp. FACHB-1515]
MKPHRLLSAAAATTIATFVQMIATAPASADHSYTYPAPAPTVAEDTPNSPEILASDRESTVFAGWEFAYATTPDENLFVTRTFIVNLGNDSLGMIAQIDCGRGTVRHVVQPRLFRNNSNTGTPIDRPTNQWMVLDRDIATGQAMMRTCEAAAQEEGIVWSWL